MQPEERVVDLLREIWFDRFFIWKLKQKLVQHGENYDIGAAQREFEEALWTYAKECGKSSIEPFVADEELWLYEIWRKSG